MEKAGVPPEPLGSKNRLQSPWLILIVVLLTSIAASLNQFKVPPVMPLLMEAFNQSVGRAGLLMSVFAITGLFLAIPAGFILQRLGYRRTGLMAVFFLILGAGIGTLSNGMDLMLASRFIEGLGLSFMAVVAPAIIALWFAAEKRGMAMGIWAVWVPLGSTIMFMLAPFLAGYWGWQGVWSFGFFYTAVIGLFFYLFIRPNPRLLSNQSNPAPARGMIRENLSGVLGNRNLWLISFLFCCFNFVYIAFITWAPTFLHQIRHTSIAHADLLVSATSILAIVAGPTAGWISDAIGSRKVICAIPLVLMAFLFPLNFSASEGLFLVLAIATGFLAGFVPTGVFSAGVEVLRDERLAGMAMAVIQIGQNSGMLLGPLVFGWVVQSWGWQTAFWILAPISLVGGISGWMVKMR